MSPSVEKRSRKPAAALKVAESSRKQAEQLAISHAGHGITELAQELADLQRLCTTLANAEGPALRARDEVAAKALLDEEHAERCQALNSIEDVQRRGNNLVEGLAQLILSLEPRTVDETLTVALILAEELDVFLSNYTKHSDCRVSAEADRLEDALHAVVRGLVHGANATSPLLSAYSTTAMLSPWYERRAIAAREAARYSVSPAKASLTKVEAAS